MEQVRGNTPGEGPQRGRWRKIAGIALAMVGFFWLAKRAGWMPMEHGHPTVFWPLVVVAVGLLLSFGRDHRAGRRIE